MARTRVKICGITRAEDAVLAAELGADAIGLNFVGGPRQITLIQGREIVQGQRAVAIAPLTVALCGWREGQRPNCLSVGEIHGRLWVDCFQIYGRSEALLMNDDDAPRHWMVFPVSRREDIVDLAVQLNVEGFHPAAIVLDTASAEKLGGTGQTFDWSWIAEARAAGELEGLPPIILAGGLTPENVAEAIRIARPYAVDVSSGVEVAGKPGIKDPIKMRDFIQAAQSA
jgi:phosphoribosylanthranilate isomerase